MGQLKSTLYARMEEVSFRSGAAVACGVLTAAGVAITLAVVLGGHSDAVASAPVFRPAIPSVVPPVLAPMSSSPPATPPATPRASRTTAPATVARAYQPPSAAREGQRPCMLRRRAAPPPRVAWSRSPRSLRGRPAGGAGRGRRRGRGGGAYHGIAAADDRLLAEMDATLIWNNTTPHVSHLRRRDRLPMGCVAPHSR